MQTATKVFTSMLRYWEVNNYRGPNWDNLFLPWNTHELGQSEEHKTVPIGPQVQKTTITTTIIITNYHLCSSSVKFFILLETFPFRKVLQCRFSNIIFLFVTFSRYITILFTIFFTFLFRKIPLYHILFMETLIVCQKWDS